MPQEWCEYAPFWPASRAVELRLAPVLSIEEVKAQAADGSETVLDPASYRLLAASSSRPILLFGVNAVLPALACAPDAVSIRYQAGYEPVDGQPAESAVPAAIRNAVLLMVGDLYRFRETVALSASSPILMSTTVDRLLAPFRRYQL